MKDITGGTAPAILWKDFMSKAHQGIPSKSLNYTNVIDDVENKKKIDRIIKKSKELRKKKNVFDSILENFF